jgi:hypothetical protein
VARAGAVVLAQLIKDGVIALFVLLVFVKLF